MNATGYAILAYVLGLGLMWGYACSIWMGHRAAARRGGQREQSTGR
jgi:hypothetical protein